MLPFSPPDIGSAEIARVTGVLKSGWITRGGVCEEFENRISDFTGARFAHCLSSATAGLFLSLKIAGIGEGDEVITTPYTFASSVNVILHASAKPVLADVEEDGFQISPQAVASKVTPRTRAVIPVHFGGHPVDLDAVREISKRHDLLVVEDAAHAIGAEYRGKRLGDGKNPCVFSFHAVKNVTTAEGGCVVTNDEKLHKALRLYSLHGQTKDAYEKLSAGGWKYDIAVPGYKFNLTDLQAAVGVEQLKRVEAITKKREEIAERYTALLKEYDFVQTPSVKKGHRSSWHLYPLLIDFSRLSIDRDRFIAALAAENISANVHYIPVHLMSYYKKTFGYRPDDFPAAYSLFRREVSLPIYPQLSFDDVERVVEAIEKLFAHYR